MRSDRVLVDLHYSPPVEAIYLTVESNSLSFEVNNSTFESYWSLSFEAKDMLATMESKCRSLVEANRSRLLKSNGCLHFEEKSESFSSVGIIDSTVESNCS